MTKVNDVIKVASFCNNDSQNNLPFSRLNKKVKFKIKKKNFMAVFITFSNSVKLKNNKTGLRPVSRTVQV